MRSHDGDFHVESRGVRVRRRLRTIPRNLLFLLVLTVAAPLLLAGALAVDTVRFVVARRPFMAVRMVTFAWVFLAVEVVALGALTVTWVVAGFGTNRRRLVGSAWPIQAWWGRTLLGTVTRMFRLRFEITGEDLILPGPVLAMFRHASIVDNLLPAVLLTDRKGLKLRWVIKKELLAVPSLDVGGNRLPNYFVDRTAADPRSEITMIRRLGDGLAEDEGVLIFPEGTRFTEAKLERAMSRLAETPHLHQRAEGLRHLLPPRTGGPLILLDAGLDVLFCAHSGLGGFAQLGDLWSGDLVGGTIRVRFWRVPASEVPTGRQARLDWLFEWWHRLDDWIELHREPVAD